MSRIVQFRARVVRPIGLRAFGAGFMMGGRFRVNIRFNPRLDCAGLEYRQFIKGRASVQQGTFRGTPSAATWRASGTLHDARNDFQIPGGLNPTPFSEDGQRRGGRVFHFGYRSRPAVQEDGLEDRYLPGQAEGREYRSLDTFGLRGTSRPRGLKIRVRLFYQGRVIDTRRGGRVIATRQWDFDGEDIIV